LTRPGDEDHASQLQERVDSFDVENYCQARASHPGRPLRRATLAKDVTQLHNPYANIEYAWQLTETVESFLQRLPPETTPQNHKTPWIFICNPFIPRAAKVDSSTTRREDDAEAPEEDGSNVQMLVTGAEERLDLLRSFIEKTEETKKTKAAKEKAIAKERSGATSDILNLAAMQKVRAGKVRGPPRLVEAFRDVVLTCQSGCFSVRLEKSMKSGRLWPSRRRTMSSE